MERYGGRRVCVYSLWSWLDDCSAFAFTQRAGQWIERRVDEHVRPPCGSHWHEWWRRLGRNFSGKTNQRLTTAVCGKVGTSCHVSSSKYAHHAGDVGGQHHSGCCYMVANESFLHGVRSQGSYLSEDVHPLSKRPRDELMDHPGSKRR